MKIRTVGAQFFHSDIWTDRRTDRTKLIDAFRNFANALKMGIWIKPNSLKRMTKGKCCVQACLKRWPTAEKSVSSRNLVALSNHPPFHLTHIQPTIIVSKLQYPFAHLSTQSTNPPSTPAITQPPTYATPNQLPFPITQSTVRLLPLLRDDSL